MFDNVKGSDTLNGFAHATKSATQDTYSHPPCSHWGRIPCTWHQLPMWWLCRESLRERHHLRILWWEILLVNKVWYWICYSFSPNRGGGGRRRILCWKHVLHLMCVFVRFWVPRMSGLLSTGSIWCQTPTNTDWCDKPDVRWTFQNDQKASENSKSLDTVWW